MALIADASGCPTASEPLLCYLTLLNVTLHEIVIKSNLLRKNVARYDEQDFLWNHDAVYNSECLRRREYLVETSGERLDKANFAETRLLDYLFMCYSHPSRPATDYSQKIDVVIAFEVTKLNEINEKEEQILLTGWLKVEWKDEKLSWKKEAFNGIGSVVLESRNTGPSKQIWMPDLALVNSDGTNMYEVTHSSDFATIASHDGSVQWYPGGKFKASCELSLTYYPFDRQRCVLQFESWNYDMNFVIYRLKGLENLTTTVGLNDVDISNAMSISLTGKNGEWDIFHHAAQLVPQSYLNGNVPLFYSRVVFSIHLRRKALYYVMTIIMPCLMLSCLGIFAFVLPCSTEGKTEIGVTILLSFAVFQLVVAEQTPRTSESYPLLGGYINMLMGIVGCSVGWSIFLSWFYYQHEYRQMPEVMFSFVFLRVGRVFGLYSKEVFRELQLSGLTIKDGQLVIADSCEDCSIMDEFYDSYGNMSFIQRVLSTFRFCGGLNDDKKRKSSGYGGADSDHKSKYLRRLLSHKSTGNGILSTSDSEQHVADARTRARRERKAGVRRTKQHQQRQADRSASQTTVTSSAPTSVSASDGAKSTPTSRSLPRCTCTADERRRAQTGTRAVNFAKETALRRAVGLYDGETAIDDKRLQNHFHYHYYYDNTDYDSIKSIGPAMNFSGPAGNKLKHIVTEVDQTAARTRPGNRPDGDRYEKILRRESRNIDDIAVNLRHIDENFAKLRKQSQNEVMSDLNKKKWLLVTQVLDRMLFLFFATTTTIIHVFVLLIIPFWRDFEERRLKAHLVGDLPPGDLHVE